jgi:hypothetical protein
MTYLVDPRRVLRVTIEEPDQDGSSNEVTAITCAYVVAENPDGTPCVALEVVTDPGNTHPTTPYYCPSERFERRLLPPRRVTKVRPYTSTMNENEDRGGGDLYVD